MREQISFSVRVVMSAFMALGTLAAPGQVPAVSASAAADCAAGPGWIRGLDGQTRALRPDCIDTTVASTPVPGDQVLDRAQAVGGPDLYGYTYDTTAAHNWIEAASGTNTGLTGSGASSVGPVALPFAFKFYEDTFTQLWISKQGVVTFNDHIDWYSYAIPSPDEPNAQIAVDRWSWGLEADSRVTYLTGGSAPNRYFVVQWTNLKGLGHSYTFQVVLWESGDIWAQYSSMDYSSGYPCTLIGIENGTGFDGLGISQGNCLGIASGSTIRYTRPAPSARIAIDNPYLGQHISAGQAVTFTVPLRNSGELGADTYTTVANSAVTWPVALFQADGSTPLADTNADGLVDTGSIPQGGSGSIVVRVTAPVAAEIGANNAATVVFTSTRDATKSRGVTLQTAVPAPFVQAMTEYGPSQRGNLLYATKANARQTLTSEPLSDTGTSAEIVALNDGRFALTWVEGRSAGSKYVNEQHIAILDQFGRQVAPTIRLSDLSTVQQVDVIWESPAAVAQTPDGRIGVLWRRQMLGDSTLNDRNNFNLWFAVLSSAGALAYGPVNVTNDTHWGTWSSVDISVLDYPHMVATADNRFVMAWSRVQYGTSATNCPTTCPIRDIYLASRESSGAQVLAPTALTHDAPGWGDGYDYPALAVLSGYDALLVFSDMATGDLQYGAYTSTGAVHRPLATLVSDGTAVWDQGPIDAATLSNGRILIAWMANGSRRLAALDAIGNLAAGPVTVSTPGAAYSTGPASIAPDAAGRAVLTWRDYTLSRVLYYTLVDSNLTVLTQPMIFWTVEGNNRVYPSDNGSGAAAYVGDVPPGGDGATVMSRALWGAEPGGGATIRVDVNSLGATPLTGGTLTATLDPALSYVGDTSGLPVNVSGNTVSWTLPTLGFLETRTFDVSLGLTGGAVVGTRYPISLNLTWSGVDANPADNTTAAEILAAHLTYLTLVRR